MDVIKDHHEFHKNSTDYPFKNFEGFDRAYFIPDNVIYTSPVGHKYLIFGNFPTENLQAVLFTSNMCIAQHGYQDGKQYYHAHTNEDKEIVYAFLPAFSEAILKPLAWFDHVKDNPKEIKRTLESL